MEIYSKTECDHILELSKSKPRHIKYLIFLLTITGYKNVGTKMNTESFVTLINRIVSQQTCRTVTKELSPVEVERWYMVVKPDAYGTCSFFFCRWFVSAQCVIRLKGQVQSCLRTLCRSRISFAMFAGGPLSLKGLPDSNYQ